MKSKSLHKSRKFVQTISSSSAADQLANVLPDDEMYGLMKRCGNLEKLVRSVAYILRLVGRCQKVKHAM